MFTIKARVDRVRKVLELIRADACVVKSLDNRRYLTGLDTSDGMVIVTRVGNKYFLVDKRYEEIAMRQLIPQGFTVKIVQKSTDYMKYINEIVQSNKVSTMLLESQGISHEAYLEFENALYSKVMPLKTQLSKLRVSKDLDEVENMKTAQRINEKTFDEILEYIQVGMTEKEVQAKLVQLLLENGSDLDKFEICLVSGSNSSLVHGRATDKVIHDGDPIMIEFGAVYNGYRSVMARTVCMGEPSEEFKKAYETVKNCFVIASKYIKKGEPTAEADKAVREFIESSGYPNCFRHSLGRGLGIDLIEGPYISSNSSEAFAVGNVVTIEPGIYLQEKFGIRIGDMFYISPNGAEDITKTTKDLIVLSPNLGYV